MSLHPEVLWAQRSSNTNDEKNIIYLTVNLPEIIESTLDFNLTPTSVSMKAKAGNASKGIEGREYEFSVDLYAEIIQTYVCKLAVNVVHVLTPLRHTQHSTKYVTSRALFAVLRKKEKQVEYWPRLTKDRAKTPFIKTDFEKWVDEDDQDSNELPAFDDDFDGDGVDGDGDFEKVMEDIQESGPGHSSMDPAESDESDDDGPQTLDGEAKSDA